jgi:hypothetical protein
METTRLWAIITFIVGVVTLGCILSTATFFSLDIRYAQTAAITLILGAVMLYPWPLIRDEISIKNRVFHAGFCFVTSAYCFAIAI